MFTYYYCLTYMGIWISHIYINGENRDTKEYTISHITSDYDWLILFILKTLIIGCRQYIHFHRDVPVDL